MLLSVGLKQVAMLLHSSGWQTKVWPRKRTTSLFASLPLASEECKVAGDFKDSAEFQGKREDKARLHLAAENGRVRMGICLLPTTPGGQNLSILTAHTP